jgi:hypothetical protein
MPNLQIKISGLCVFAFDRPLKKAGPPPTRATLLLPKLTHARALNNFVNQRYEVLDQHFPLLVFDLDARDPASTRDSDFLVPDTARTRIEKGVCLLFGDDLTITTDDGKVASKLNLDQTPPTKPLATTVDPKERQSLWWMATLEDAFPGKGEVNPLFIDNPPGSNQAVLARVQLTQGRLASAELTDHPCTFMPPGNPKFYQRIATSFTLDLPFKEKIEINIERREDGKISPSQLILRPPSRSNFTIEIKNMEIDELIGMKKSYSPRPEADFEVYADILAQPIVGKPPFLRQTGPGSPAGVTFSTCPPAGG